MATLTNLVEKNDMGDEMKERMNETELDKFIPIAHGNECSLYELMRFDIRSLFEEWAPCETKIVDAAYP